MRVFALIAAACFVLSAQAQLVVKTGNDGTIYSPQPVKATSFELTTPVISGAVTGTFSLPSTATVVAASVVATTTAYATDGAVALASGVAILSKTSAGAYTIAAPGAAGLRITFTTTTDFAHVVTFTGGTLWDGTAGANTTWTAAAVQGSSLTVVSISSTKWNVESFNLGTIAP